MITASQAQEMSSVLFLSWVSGRALHLLPSYQFVDAPAHGLSGSPDSVLLPIQSHFWGFAFSPVQFTDLKTARCRKHVGGESFHELLNCSRGSEQPETDKHHCFKFDVGRY